MRGAVGHWGGGDGGTGVPHTPSPPRAARGRAVTLQRYHANPTGIGRDQTMRGGESIC